jgi:hypothetical protein
VTPEARKPLEVVQIDHTMIDLIVVEPVSRQPVNGGAKGSQRGGVFGSH